MIDSIFVDRLEFKPALSRDDNTCLISASSFLNPTPAVILHELSMTNMMDMFPEDVMKMLYGVLDMFISKDDQALVSNSFRTGVAASNIVISGIVIFVLTVGGAMMYLNRKL